MKLLVDTQGYRAQCSCGETTTHYQQVGAATEAYKEHHQLEHDPSTQGGFSYTPKENQ